MELLKVIQHSGTDLTCVNAARISFQKESEYDKINERWVREDGYGDDDRSLYLDYDLVLKEADRKLLKYLLKNKHFSVFEHCSITFWVKAPIFVMRQWMRHKWCFNEISGRYVELDPFYYIPPCMRPPHDTNRQGSKDTSIMMDRVALGAYKEACDYSISIYHNLLDMGVCKEQARMVLPLSLFTEVYATANLRSILHFLDQRLDPHAQLEIQDYAKLVLAEAKKLFPEVIGIWEELKNVN